MHHRTMQYAHKGPWLPLSPTYFFAFSPARDATFGGELDRVATASACAL